MDSTFHRHAPRLCGILTFALGALLASGEAGAQLRKCASPAGGIVFTDEPCEKQGLRPAGIVEDRLTPPAAGPKPPPTKPGDKEEPRRRET